MTAAAFATAPPGIRVQFYSGCDGLQPLHGSWSTILRQKARPRFFQEYAWYQGYLTHLEPEPETVCFALVSNAADPLAIIPLQRVGISFHGLISKLWRLPENDQLLLADVIAADGVSGTDIIRALAAGMHSRGMQWDRVQFTGFGDDSCLNSVDLGCAAYRDILTTSDEVICNKPWDTFARRFSANFRSNLNKARHKIERAGGASYEIVNNPAGLAELFPEFLRVETSGWKGPTGAGTAVALDPRRLGFYQALIDGFASSGRIYINVMRFAGRVISSQLCITDSDTIYVLKQGYDESFAHLAPGNSLLEQLVRWCYATKSFRAINQVGRPHWFQDWKPEHCSNIYRLHCFNSTPLGQIHRLKYAVRASLRALRVARPEASNSIAP